MKVWCSAYASAYVHLKLETFNFRKKTCTAPHRPHGSNSRFRPLHGLPHGFSHGLSHGLSHESSSKASEYQTVQSRTVKKKANDLRDKIWLNRLHFQAWSLRKFLTRADETGRHQIRISELSCLWRAKQATELSTSFDLWFGHHLVLAT